MSNQESRQAPAVGLPSEHSYPPPRTTWYVIAMLALINALDTIDRGVISLSIQPIKRDLLLSDTEIGILTGIAFSGFYALVGLPMSRFADTGNRKAILGSGVIIWSLATAAGSLAHNFWHLFASRGATGAGESLKGPNALSMISDLVPREKLPSAMSLYTLGISGGTALSMIIGGWLLGYFEGHVMHGPFGLRFHDWQMVMLLVGFPGVAVAIIFLTTVKEPVRRNRKVGKVPALEVFRFMRQHSKFYSFFLIGTGLLQIEAIGLLAWRFPFYERTYGWDAATAGPPVGLLTLFTWAIGLFLGGWLGGKMARSGDPGAMIKLALGGLACSLPLTVAFPLMPSPWLAMIVSGLASLATGISVPATNSALQIVTPNEFRGQVTAIYLFTVSVVGAALAPLTVSLITDFVFRDEAMLRYSMASMAVIFGSVGLAVKFCALKPYRERLTQIMADEELAARQPS